MKERHHFTSLSFSVFGQIKCNVEVHTPTISPPPASTQSEASGTTRDVVLETGVGIGTGCEG